MLSLHGVPLVLQLGVPLALLGWHALGRDRSITGWLVKTGVVVVYLAAVAVAGLWLVLPWYTPLVFASLLGVVAVWRFGRVQRLPWRAGRPSWISLGIRGALAAFAIVVLMMAVEGRRLPPVHVVDLAFPLRAGTYYVTGGGSSELLNPHVRTLTADRFRAYRGQSYGIDVVKLGFLGTRASGLLPSEPARYTIYGDTVYAPCAGLVVQTEDGFQDMPPPQPDRADMPGNHVLLECDGVHVLLAHLQRGTVRVRAHERVSTGAIVGQVGNSGNSNEPHLHVHAQRPARKGHEPLSGDPLPIRLDGRVLVRNDRVRSTGLRR